MIANNKATALAVASLAGITAALDAPCYGYGTILG